MYEFMQNKPYVMVNSTREGVEYVRDSEGRYAFFLEAALNDYYNGRYPCDTMMVGKNLDYKGNECTNCNYSIALDEKNYFSPFLNVKIFFFTMHFPHQNVCEKS